MSRSERRTESRHAREDPYVGETGPGTSQDGGPRSEPPPAAPSSAASTAGPLDPATLLRSPEYLRLLALAAVIGVPISAAAYYFLQLVGFLQAWVFKDLPQTLGFGATPLWWPLPILGIAGCWSA
jgi:hypothetical protein